MPRQSAEHIKGRAAKLRATAARRTCPNCSRKGGMVPITWTWRKCRYCGHNLFGKHDEYSRSL